MGTVPAWGRFSKHAKLAIHHATAEAQNSGRAEVCPEHLLVGVLSLEGYIDVPRSILERRGVSVNALREEARAEIQPGERSVENGDIDLSPAAGQVLDASWEEARSLGGSYIGAENILLGLLAVRDTAAARVLQRFGITLDGARAAIRRLSEGSSDSCNS